MADEMLKIVIVDDEYLIRNLVRNCINWSDLGMIIAGEAECAQEAIQLVENVHPDILFIDINMPFMNGIELSRIITEKYPYIKIIILTGYEEFEYAKNSVKIGISDFLTKPVNTGEIRQSVLRVKDKIELERNQQDELIKIKMQLAESMPYARDSFLNELLQKNLDADNALNKIDFYGITLKGPDFQAAVVEVEVESKTSDAVPDEETVQMLKLRFISHIQHVLRNTSYIYVFFDNSQRIVILCSDPEVNLVDCCENIKGILVEYLHYTVVFGIGNSHKGMKNIYLSYKEACEALKYKIIVGKNNIISYNEIVVQKNEPAEFEGGNIDDLRFFIKTGVYDKATELIDLLFGSLKFKPNLSLTSFRIIALDIISAILNTINGAGINQMDVFGQVQNPYDELFKIDTIPSMKQYLNRIVQKCTILIGSMRNAKEVDIIQAVQCFLHENMADFELSLQKAGNVFYINQSYLSRLFKQKAGVNFIEYLTDIRVRKAIELLKETDLKVYQIAEKVGIIDPHYLGVCFKKMTGMSMSEYKRKLIES